jgi:hypothetical protein
MPYMGLQNPPLLSPDCLSGLFIKTGVLTSLVC